MVSCSICAACHLMNLCRRISSRLGVPTLFSSMLCFAYTSDCQRNAFFHFGTVFPLRLRTGFQKSPSGGAHPSALVRPAAPRDLARQSRPAKRLGDSSRLPSPHAGGALLEAPVQLYGLPFGLSSRRPAEGVLSKYRANFLSQLVGANSCSACRVPIAFRIASRLRTLCLDSDESSPSR